MKIEFGPLEDNPLSNGGSFGHGPSIIFVPVPGEPGPPGPAAGVYSFRQATPAASWTVVHNLGTPREPTVLLDSQPTIPVLTDVEHPDNNTTIIIFPEPVTGWAYL